MIITIIFTLLIKTVCKIRFNSTLIKYVFLCRNGVCLDSIATNLDKDRHETTVSEPIFASFGVHIKVAELSVSHKALSWHADYTFSYRVLDDEAT